MSDNVPMKRLKIAFVTTGLARGGAEVMLLRLLESLDRERFEPSVICLSSTGPVAELLSRMGVPPVVLSQRAALFAVLGLPKLVAALRAIRPDIIQGWMYHGNVAAALAAPFLENSPALLWNVRMAGEDFETEKRLTRVVIRVGALLAPRVHWIVANSRKGALTHAVRLGYKGRWRVIPNGFDTVRFAPGMDAPAELQALASASVRIGMIARHHPIKDHDTFLTAAALLSRSDPAARFVLVGEGTSWDNRDLVASISRHGLREKILLMGSRSDIPQVAACLDIVTLCSISEGFPNAIGEAMSCGVPCVVTDVGDAALLVGDTGLVVPARDPAALCVAWRELAALGAPGRRSLGDRARRRIVDHFTIGAIGQRYQDLYEQAARPADATTCAA